MKQPNESVVNPNFVMYDPYYRKPDWWFRFRYDTQVKRRTCLYLLRKIKRNLSHQRVLEIGFGSGAVLFSFDRSCELHGIEISRSAVERAERKARERGYQSSKFAVGHADLLPYPDEHFDVIIASHVIEHVEDDSKLLQEMRRTLSQDGVAIVLIPINENYDDPNHVHHYTSQTFIDLARRNLLDIKHVIENELLFHFVERFYFEEYNKRWKVLGPMIAIMFNFPTSILPFWMYQLIDQAMIFFGWKPRQLGCALAKPADDSTLGL